MFKFDTQCNPKQISLTGVRAICILSLLSKKPRTFEEIKEFLIESNIVTREYSIDTIRIDMNTLKYIGCDISKAIKSTNNMYTLRSHPFQLDLNEEDIETLIKIYRNIYKNLSIKRLLDYDALFEKLSSAVKNEQIKEMLLGISVLKGLDKNLIQEFIVDAKRQTKMKIEYLAGNTSSVKYDITVEDLGFRSGKLYIFCYNHTLKKRTFLNFSRLKQVLARCLRGDSVQTDDIVMEFELKNYQNYTLEDSEQIIAEKDNVARIKGRYYTEFIAIQRALSFASDCTILEPTDMKEKLISVLQNMRKQYG